MKHCLIIVRTECSITLVKNKYIIFIIIIIVILFKTNTISVDYLDPLNFRRYNLIQFSIYKLNRGIEGLLRCYNGH